MPHREPSTEPLALAELTEPQRAQAMGRFAVLRPHLEQNVPYLYLERPWRPVYRCAPRSGGSPDIASAGWLVSLAHHGTTLAWPSLGRQKVAGEMAECIEGLYLRKPRPSVATIRRCLLKVANERQWTVPSYASASIYRIVRRLDPGMVTLARAARIISPGRTQYQ
jgi:putative transposase